MIPILKHLQNVRERISAACIAAGRREDAVLLLAVSKNQPVASIAAALAAGQTRFAESYAQEAIPKITALAQQYKGPLIEWHFVGPLQSNKTACIAPHFAWVHTVHRLKTAQRLSEQRPCACPALNVCVQVNLSGEPHKSGCSLEALYPLCQSIADLPHIQLRGLMTLPDPRSSPTQQRQVFAQLRQCLIQLNAKGFALDTLSMGMSGDFEDAISEGATIVRIGSAIFGQRHSKGTG
jgi:pyridoxal phosphate enzyme (YggS family)